STKGVLELLNAESHPDTGGTVLLHGNDHFVAFEKLKLANGSIDSRIEPDEFVVVNLTQPAASSLADILSLRQTPEEGAFVVGGWDITALTPESLYRQEIGRASCRARSRTS